MIRIAFFSPLPPCRSGIADYSAALLEPLRQLARVDVIEGPAPAGFTPSAYDVAVYQIGNNAHHEGAYRAALDHPGVVVLHEANLHHLVAEITIKRGDWAGYLAAVEREGGPQDVAFAHRVRRLETGPDYEGVPMLRRVLSGARGVIAHSRFVAEAARAAGYSGPLAVIPHGAWTGGGGGHDYRLRLGLTESTPLAGMFGHLKPYKRIPEALRAFRRLWRLVPEARMIVAGEPHPDLDVNALIRSLDVAEAVRCLGFVSDEDLNGYLAACNVVLNLRYPTVGETSGTLLRAFGAGKAVLVSDVGAFHELPDDICLKVPPGAGEEDLLFEYLNLLVTRPESRKLIGQKARRWAETHCAWPLAARRYAAFLEAVVSGAPWPPLEEPPLEGRPVAAPAQRPSSGAPAPWTGTDPGARSYTEAHRERLRRTLALTPPGSPRDRILEMGAYLMVTPALHYDLGYGEVRGCYYGPAGRIDHKEVTAEDGRRFVCDLDLFDAEKDPFPYPDEHFLTVLCGELIEHLAVDPMHMMSEINRVLKPGGHLVLTTPNIGSLRAISAILLGYHPGFFPAYIRPHKQGEEPDSRHNREYTPKEIARLLIDSGFEMELIETGPFREEPRPEHAWVEHLLDRYELDPSLRGDGIYAVGRKIGPVRTRYPEWLYN